MEDKWIAIIVIGLAFAGASIHIFGSESDSTADAIRACRHACSSTQMDSYENGKCSCKTDGCK